MQKVNIEINITEIKKSANKREGNKMLEKTKSKMIALAIIASAIQVGDYYLLQMPMIGEVMAAIIVAGIITLLIVVANYRVDIKTKRVYKILWR